MKINKFSIIGLALTVAGFIIESMQGAQEQEKLKEEIKEELKKEMKL